MPKQAMLRGRGPSRSGAAREHALETASRLFYREGVRAIGIEQIVEASGIAKTTIYRHFATKDALVEAFLAREDETFCRQWDDTIKPFRADAWAALMALCDWIGAKVFQAGYRGCPQINVAAEFSDPCHPARLVAKRHKAEMHRRLTELCRKLDVGDPVVVAMQIGLLFDGAFMSDGRLERKNARKLLREAVAKLIGIKPLKGGQRKMLRRRAADPDCFPAIPGSRRSDQRGLDQQPSPRNA
jgi:AcrR family transcriptional regulator